MCCSSALDEVAVVIYYAFESNRKPSSTASMYTERSIIEMRQERIHSGEKDELAK